MGLVYPVGDYPAVFFGQNQTPPADHSGFARQQKQLDKELQKIEEQLSSGIMKIDAEGLQKMRK